ncbi:MAG: hypothetical protein IT360_26675 [Gemmatimonadaceae bacterium]|nr:hypothetical protein [Gemmatimonadaceae bacterium]
MRSLSNRLRSLVALCAVSMFATACSDSATSPLAPNSAALSTSSTAHAARWSGNSSSKSPTKSATRNSNKLAGSPATVGVLSFKSGINTNTSATKVIGPAGGFLTLSETGFTLFVPAGAVLTPTTFKVTPVGGSYVAYDFEPHGASFAVPLTFMQALSKTNYVSGAEVGGAYFSDKSLIDTAGGTANVSELFTLSFDGFGLSFFSITHFSGYLVSMG